MIHLLAKLREHEVNFRFQGATESQRTQPINEPNLLSKRVQEGSLKKGLQKLNAKRLGNDLLKDFGDGRN